MNSFVYDIPVKVYFGQNQLHHLGEELAKYGRRVLLTYGGGSISHYSSGGHGWLCSE